MPRDGSHRLNRRQASTASSGDDSTSREKDNKAAYTERLVIPIAFSKVDGLAALEAWPFIEESLTSESSAMSGGGVAVCGRATLAWILQSSLGMELRRYFVRAPQLHTWDRKDAEASAGERAVGMLEEATKQHNEYLQRVKTSGGEIATGSDSKRGNLMHIPRMPAAAFFPDNMSPTTVTPELPARGASQFCDLALDALGLCDSCASDTRALTTVDVTQGTHGGAEMLHCSTLLGTDDASWTRVTDESGQGGTVFRSFNPLHGVVHDTEGPAHKYVQSLGQPDIFV